MRLLPVQTMDKSKENVRCGCHSPVFPVRYLEFQNVIFKWRVLNENITKNKVLVTFDQ